ncbi:AAA family ATPase [Roseomonas rosulenta]|uniref:AAA family ATPase n=1 Tax=Roseomonas rosulenta TaxID=2748667 RepID=UPI0018DFBA4A|nr:ATP-binding protein [Roseomonas rosulenta]
MEADRPATLHLFCGRIAAGKSTLARQLASAPGTLLIGLDDWMSTLYPTENQSLDDFVVLTARMRAIMGPHIVALLGLGVSVALDFPANTKRWRDWMRGIIEESGAQHEMHVLDVPDAVCRARLRRRNDSGEHAYTVDEATYDLFMRHFSPPTAAEGFNRVVHKPRDTKQ